MQFNEISSIEAGFKDKEVDKRLRFFKISDNHKKISLIFMNYGLTMLELKVPDKSGTLINILLRYPALKDYFFDEAYLCTIIGRFPNRIQNGRFQQPDGEIISLALNNGNHTLHGGKAGWNKKFWQPDEKSVFFDDMEAGIILDYKSPSGEEGFQGEVLAKVKVSINSSSQLKLNFSATSDTLTPLGITTHAYFNLSGGDFFKTISDHIFYSNANRYIPVNSELIPTGDILPLNSDLDFNKPSRISSKVQKEFDHCFIFPETKSGKVKVFSPDTGISCTLKTTLPAYQFYSGNFLKSPFIKHQGFCLEPQRGIDVNFIYRNRNILGTPFISKEKIYQEEICFCFSIEADF